MTIWVYEGTEPRQVEVDLTEWDEAVKRTSTEKYELDEPLDDE